LFREIDRVTRQRLSFASKSSVTLIVFPSDEMSDPTPRRSNVDAL
jgi:hypothetical protein